MLDTGEEWTFEDVEPSSEIAGEQVTWGQGIGWTGFTLEGINIWTIFQVAFSNDTTWGQGIGWTGITEFLADPVFSDFIKQLWQNSFVDPMSLPEAGMDVLVGQGIGWTGMSPIFLNPMHPAFPQP